MEVDDHRCPICGQGTGAPHLHGADFVEEVDAARPVDRSVVLKGGAVLIVALIGIALLSDRGGNPEPAATPEISLPDRDTDPNEDSGPQANDVLTDNDPANQMDAARSALRELIGQHQLAYAVDGGVAIVDPGADDEPTRVAKPVNVTINDLFGGFGGFIMFDDGGRTHGFKRHDAPEELTVYRLSSQGQIIAGEKNEFALAAHPSLDPAYIYVGNSAGIVVSRLDVAAVVGSRREHN